MRMQHADERALLLLVYARRTDPRQRQARLADQRNGRCRPSTATTKGQTCQLPVSRSERRHECTGQPSCGTGTRRQGGRQAAFDVSRQSNRCVASSAVPTMSIEYSVQGERRAARQRDVCH